MQGLIIPNENKKTDNKSDSKDGKNLFRLLKIIRFHLLEH